MSQRYCKIHATQPLNEKGLCPWCNDQPEMELGYPSTSARKAVIKKPRPARTAPTRKSTYRPTFTAPQYDQPDNDDDYGLG